MVRARTLHTQKQEESVSKRRRLYFVTCLAVIASASTAWASDKPACNDPKAAPAVAIESCTLAIGAAAAGDDRAQLLIIRGDWRAVLHKHEQAIDDYRTAATTAVMPRIASIAHQRAADVLSHAFLPDEALDEFDKAVAADGLNWSAIVQRAELRGHVTGNRNDVMSGYDSAVAAAPLDPEPLILRAKKRLAARDKALRPSVLEDLGAAVQRAPGNVAVRLVACMASLDDLAGPDDYAFASTHCEAAVALKPDSKEARFSRGSVQLLRRRWQEAWDDCEFVARRTQPSELHWAAVYCRGSAAANLGRPEEGNADMVRADAAAPGAVRGMKAFGFRPVRAADAAP